MTAALLASKYRIPDRRPNAVPRSRLAVRLAEAGSCALTVVSAPAGFGKTTLLTEWLSSLPAGAPAVAWLSLDDRDNDPTVFWTYVVAALHAAAPGVGDAASRELTSSTPSTEAVLAALLNEVSRLPSELLLVLDDFHLIESPAVHEAMAFILDHQPPQLRLVLATRADPPLPLARLRAGGHLVEVRAADLRFTAEESAEYLNGPMRLGLTDADVVALDRRTEGWIAALQLAALSMQGRADASNFIAGFAGDDRYIVDYLAEEVLGRQPAAVRDFLLETSILAQLTGPLCDAVTGQAGGKATLAALDRANLFVIPLDDRRQWYRYHHLFADVLQAHLRDERGEDVDDLHRRASGWFDAAGDASQAVAHALAGNDLSRAADLMELAVPVMRRDRREVEFGHWIRAVPDDVLRLRPVLALAFVGGLAQASDFRSVAARLSDIEDSLRSTDGSWPDEPPPGLIVLDRGAYPSLPAGIELYRAALALVGSDLDGTSAHARLALSLTPPGDDLTRSAAGALAGLAAWTIGDLSEAHAAYTQTVAGLAGAGSIADVVGCCITLGDIRRTQGRLHDAARTYEWALELAAPPAEGEPVRGTADMHIALAGLLVERDELEAAKEHVAVAERLGKHNGLPQNPYRTKVVTARLREAEGDLDGAVELLDEADRVYAGDYAPNVQPVPAMRARLQVRRGELEPAAEWVAERQLSPRDDLSYLREYEHVTLARVLLARSQLERDDQALVDAGALVERLLVAAEDGGRGGTVIELLVLQALVHQCRRDLPAAVRALRRAVTLAAPERYVRLFAEEGAPMAVLLKALAKSAPTPTYLRRLGTAIASADRPAGGGQLVDPLSQRELDVLRWLGSELDGPDIARQLSVSLNTLRTHTKSIYAKLGVTSRRAAVRHGQELDLLPDHGRR